MIIKDVEKLRELTGAGVVDCKKALDEADGDLDKAVKVIHEKGLVKAQKKGSRSTGAGLLESYLHNERVGVLLELRCETDFVVRSEIFRDLAHNIIMQIAAMNPSDVESLLSQPYVKDDSTSVENVIKTVIAKTGENIKVERFCRYEV